MAADAAIEASGLRKFYGDVCALDGIDLHVSAGTVLGLLGPNGAGKTTAVRLVRRDARPLPRRPGRQLDLGRGPLVPGDSGAIRRPLGSSL